MNLKFDLIVIDLEMNQPSGEIIEIGAVKYMRDGTIYPEIFQQYVSITDDLSPDIIKLTGITNNKLNEKGLDLFSAVLKLREWAVKETKNVILAGWGSDVAYLRRAVEGLQKDWQFRGMSVDIKSFLMLYTGMLNIKPESKGLNGYLQAHGLVFDNVYGNAHRAASDAYNTARLLQKVVKDFEDTKTVLLGVWKKLGE